jgi:hypothetical protein
MIKKFESFSDDFKEDLKEYLSDVIDLYDTKITIWTKEEYLESEEVKSGRINGNQSRLVEQANYVVKTNIKPNPDIKREFSIANINKPTEYSLEGAIKSSKHNFDLLSSIKNGLEGLGVSYKFYIKDTYQCYFFIE